jgi:hypothetical protein
VISVKVECGCRRAVWLKVFLCLHAIFCCYII